MMSIPKVRITKRKQVGKREQEIALIVEDIAYPIICEECWKFGITPPRIEWVVSITVNGKEHKGAYHHRARERLLYQNLYTITAMLEREEAEEDTIALVVRSCFHELKHYIDDECYKVSMQEIRQNYNKYEKEADEYAEELMKINVKVKRDVPNTT